jgi:hypothetical protein
MFSKPDFGEGVTKADLISEAAGFLGRRSFEDPDEAIVAAREFVDFCRGRAWVFSDAGSTAEGEPLYAFTHRTFMEYFAASYLASAHDTPEKLAQSLAPHIARSEWDVVGQLAVQIKNKSSMDGAERIYTYLLEERRRRAAGGRAQILAFLSRCLTFYEPPPSLTRRLVREVVAVTLALRDNRDSRIEDARPLGWLLASCQGSREYVRDELAQAIESLVASDDEETAIDGVALAAELGIAVYLVSRNTGGTSFESRAKYWTAFSKELIGKYRAELLAAARSETSLAMAALQDGPLSVEEYVQGSRSRLRILFHETRWRILPITSSPFLPFIIQRLTVEDEAQRDIAALQLASVARTLEGIAGPPWLNRVSLSGGRYLYYLADVVDGKANVFSDRLENLSEDAYFGLALTTAIMVERTSRIGRREHERFLPNLGALYPYFIRRNEPAQEVALPTLPISAPRQELLTSWADGRIDFLARPRNVLKRRPDHAQSNQE